MGAKVIEGGKKEGEATGGLVSVALRIPRFLTRTTTPCAFSRGCGH
jgi:hypothetical protein